MKLDVSNLLLDELVELRDKLNGMIWEILVGQYMDIMLVKELLRG